MKSTTILCAAFALFFCQFNQGTADSLFRINPRKNLTDSIPLIKIGNTKAYAKFEKVADVAEYGGASWNNVIGICRGITVEEALKIASSDPKISYFFYMKSGAMSLNANDGNFRAFRQGDAVFFSGLPNFGAATGFADGYIKEHQISS